ncbi:MAG: hypothetical protein QOF78_3267 [Phycisphaerales bacterium]|jgi:hypothetical protein|nr:hypothetical protein [Phycisphaerales bacterium]
MPAEQNRPASPQKAPDPSNSYERSHPENESGQGRLDNNSEATPQAQPDRQQKAVKNKQDPARQINAQDTTKSRGEATPEQPDHSMHDEEPLDSDLAPSDIHDKRQKRHPRTEGRGGTP